jgi:two-component system, chemotaxis family, protein-glutamate methylesterase/glutaminase
MEGRAVTGGRRIRVLIVDDSAIVRKVLSDVLADERDIEVVGTAPDPYIARDKILALEPDVLTLDIEMPRMDGLTFLEKLMRYRPMPVIMISSLAGPSTHVAVEGLRRGAVEVLAKPGGPYSVGELKAELAGKIRAAAASRPRLAEEAPARNAAAPAPAAPVDLGGLLVIGASTGGTQAIEAVLRNLPSRFPAIAIVQHIPSGFSRAFAERLNKLGPLRVAEAVEGQALEPGLALIAPGDFHMKLERAGSGWKARIGTGPKVCYQRPSVDVLFESAAREAGARATAILLTGMGSDGAEGMLTMRRAGAFTIAQNEATCVVFGMPREAIRRGAAEQVAGLSEIPGLLLGRLSRSAAPPTAPRPWQTA